MKMQTKLGVINLLGYKPSRYELLRLFGEKTMQAEQVRRHIVKTHDMKFEIGWDVFYDAMLRRKIDIGSSSVDEVRQVVLESLLLVHDREGESKVAAGIQSVRSKICWL